MPNATNENQATNFTLSKTKPANNLSKTSLFYIDFYKNQKKPKYYKNLLASLPGLLFNFHIKYQ